MPIYFYTAINQSGEFVKGSINSENKLSAYSELKDKNLYVQKIKSNSSFSFYSAGISGKELLRLIKSIRSLLGAGLPLSDTLKIISKNAESKKISVYVDNIHKDVIEGASFSLSCKKHGNLFDDVFVSAIGVGEKSGDLIQSLENYENYLVRKLYINKKVKSALTYPLFLTSALVVVIGVLFVYVVPNFSELFASFDAQLPAPTRLIINISEYIHYIGLILLLVGFGIFLFIKFSGNNKKIKLRLDRIFTGIPIVGPMRRCSQIARLTNSFASLLRCGVPASESVQILRDSFDGTHLGELLKASSKFILEGGSVYDSFVRYSIFNGYSLNMLSIGEKASQLEPVLTDISLYQNDELDEKIDSFTRLLEPILILFMGLLMGFVIISMYLPIFFISDVVQ
ncbi:type II secretion system F family protein [Sessilibacter sp. MAH1]